ncbi:hypothetical protein KY290_022686 [Solanum tuberosum]|uniref:F-box associated beta-propeller type 3 domain-containing protein n=1 Tax=Solanum tuberosum TaxID=4113 RepID=A0ABQ7V606_SOLTU|nr:hypothetical protein KY289_021795 [Solanum tuberosum]KAH0694426.1 hypothetical protein KY285_021523 [Solanum tuberosum]KAH0759193.1 hypothetical protein KY290_022686 [Solanum tuberosum]
MRFKCVSKFYDSIVLEPNFVDLHLSNYSKVNRGDTKLIAILDDVSCSVKEHDEDENATKFYQIENFNNFYDHIIGCWDYYLRFEYDNGLFCIWNAKYIAICNPATREVRYPPYLKCFDVFPHGEEFVCSIGFEPEENKYKVILTIDTNDGLSRAWVLTLGIDKSWREMIQYAEHDYYITPYRSGICISGIIYRFCYSSEYCIVAFDVKSEIFTRITTLIELFGNNIHESEFDYMLIEVNGKLGILNFSKFWCTENIHLLIFEGGKWEHQIFQFPLGWKPNNIYLSTYKICKYGGEEIVFAIKLTSSDVLLCFVYDVKNNSWRRFEVQEFPDRTRSIFTYSESLFPLENIGTIHHQP